MFIQSVVSKAGRVVVSADQLRVALRVHGRLSVDRRKAAVSARLAEDFGGYLVTDCEIEPVEAAFSARRWWHQSMAGGAWKAGDFASNWDYQPWVGDVDRAAIDAPSAVAAGSCVLLAVLRTGTRVAGASVVSRGRS